MAQTTCPYCGNPVHDFDLFCEHCGSPIDQNQNGIQYRKPAPMPAPKPAPKPAPMPTPRPAPRPMPTPRPASRPVPAPIPAVVPAAVPARSVPERESRDLHAIVWPVSLILLFIGLVLFPTDLRDPIVRYFWSSKFSSYNFFAFLAVWLLLATKRDYTWQEAVLYGLWLLLLIPIFASNEKRLGMDKMYRTVMVVVNQWFPLFLLIQRVPAEDRKKTLGIVLKVFNGFILVIFVMAVLQRFFNIMLVEYAVDWLRAQGFKPSSYTSAVRQYYSAVGNRTFSFWGLPLTNSLLYTAFFIMNDAYYRSIGKRYPKLLVFSLTLAGQLMTASKMAMAVVLVYLIVSSWKHKRWMFIYLLGIIPVWMSGLFQQILIRLQTTKLTTGRWDAVVKYFQAGNYPLRFFTGYGTDIISSAEELSNLDNAFEFPPLAFALMYGILFSLLFFGSIFFYYSWQTMKRRQWITWAGITLFFLEANTFRRMMVVTHDNCWIVMFVIFFCLNTALLAEQTPPEPSRPKERGIKAFLLHVLCGE